MVKKEEKICKIIKDMAEINFKVSKGLLRSHKICFKQPISRQERENIDKELRKCKLNTIWGNDCVLIR